MHRGVLVPSTNMSQLASQSDSFTVDWSSLYVCFGSGIQPQPDQQPPRCPPLRRPTQPVAYVLVSHATHTFSIATWLSFSTISSVCLRCLYILESCSHINSSLILDSTWNMGSSVSSVGKHATTQHIIIHTRTIELLPYQDFPICRLSRNEWSSDFKILLHVSIKERHVTIQDRCIANTLPLVDPLLNIDSMLYGPILVIFTLEWYLVKCSWSIRKTWWLLLHPKLTEDTFRMMLLDYPKINQKHHGPPYMLAGNAICGERVQHWFVRLPSNLNKWPRKTTILVIYLCHKCQT